MLNSCFKTLCQQTCPPLLTFRLASQFYIYSPPALRRPASVYTSVGESEGSAAPQHASTLSCTGPELSSSWYMAARSSHLFSATLASIAAAF